jgi:hypothetical protein
MLSFDKHYSRGLSVVFSIHQVRYRVELHDVPIRDGTRLPLTRARNAQHLAPCQRTCTSPSGATAADSAANLIARSSQHRQILPDSRCESSRRFPAVRLLDLERGRPSRAPGGWASPNRISELAGTCWQGRRPIHPRRAGRFLGSLQHRSCSAPQGFHGCRRLG